MFATYYLPLSNSIKNAPTNGELVGRNNVDMFHVAGAQSLGGSVHAASKIALLAFALCALPSSQAAEEIPPPERMAEILSVAGDLKPPEGVTSTDHTLGEVSRWLDKMGRALMQARYAGELEYRTDGTTKRIHVQESWFGGVRHLRMRQRGGGAEIIRRGKEIICLHPGTEADGLRQVSESSGDHLSELASKVKNLTVHYKFQRVASSPVAGRPTVSIDMKAKDAYRFHHRV
jgi:hypothetical protein